VCAALLITHAVYNLHPRIVKFKETITIGSLVGDYFCPNALRYSTTMKFRPCIDIHQGKVKQIVGSTLTDVGVTSNFESTFDSSHYARLFQENRLSGGHIIQLDQSESTLSAAKLAVCKLVAAFNRQMRGATWSTELRTSSSHRSYFQKETFLWSDCSNWWMKWESDLLSSTLAVHETR